MKLQINSDYLALVPRPEKIQLNMLRYSMQEDGQQVSIIVNQNGVILDGHTRFNICNELGLEPKFKIKKFSSIEAEKEFVVSANVNRRQLTLFERAEVLFSWWKEEKKRSRSEGAYAIHATRRTGITHGGTVTGKKERLLNRFAKIIGTNATLAHEVTWLLLHAPEETKAKLRKEEITIDEAYVDLAKPSRIPRSSYKYPGRLRYPKCLNCGKPTVNAKNADCHVHSQLCCTKCGWGN